MTTLRALLQRSPTSRPYRYRVAAAAAAAVAAGATASATPSTAAVHATTQKERANQTLLRIDARLERVERTLLRVAGRSGVITREEVTRHSTAEDCWIVIGDRVYDVTSWLADHPGKAAPILKLAGQDATIAFWKFHAQEILAEYAQRFDIGAVAGGALCSRRAESGRGGGESGLAMWGGAQSVTEEEFDYVVVGAGSAGCLVANRLLRGGFSVCLLEAGGIAEQTVRQRPFSLSSPPWAAAGHTQPQGSGVAGAGRGQCERPNAVLRGFCHEPELGPGDSGAA